MGSVAAAREPSLTLSDYKGHVLTPPIRVMLPHNLTKEEFLRLLPDSPSTQHPAFTFIALQNWLLKLLANFKLQEDEQHPYHKHPYKLREIDVQAVDWFWRGKPKQEDKLGFMKIQAKIETDAYIHDGETTAKTDWLPGAVFLRGGSAAVLIIIQPADATHDNEKYVILTVQPRIAAGSLAFVEIPAGMLDGDSFKGAAAKEIEEEAKLKVKERDLIDLSALALRDIPVQPWQRSANLFHTSQTSYDETVDAKTKTVPDMGGALKYLDTVKVATAPPIVKTRYYEAQMRATETVEEAMYPSVGACDEFIPLFLLQKRLTRPHMEWLKGKATGLRDEGENITLKLVPLSRAWREGARDAKALAALALYQNLKMEGHLPNMPAEVEAEPKELK